MEHQQAAANHASERYILDELTAVEREAFEEHFFSCEICAQEVKDLSILQGAMKESDAQLSPSQQIGASKYVSPKKPWFFQSWWSLPRYAFLIPGAVVAAMLILTLQLQQATPGMEPQVLASVMLRPETRGQVATLAAQQLGEFVLLECDVPFAATELNWEIRIAGSSHPIRRGVTKAPEPGATFKLLIPSSMLKAAEYTLRIEAVGNTSEVQKRSSTYSLKIN